MNERLIELVRNHNVLYNSNDPDYVKSKLKNRIWRDIAVDISLNDGNEAKSLWLKLRNCHRDALRRQKKCQQRGAPASSLKQWKYQKQMEFLLPYMANRPREGNLDDDSESNEMPQLESVDTIKIEYDILEYDEEMPDNTQDNDEPHHEIKGDKHLSSIDNEYTEENNDTITELPSTSKIPQSRPTTKKSKKDDLIALIKQSIKQHKKRAKERALERNKMKVGEKTLQDDLYHFFMSMYQITKKMTPSNQRIVRNSVFQMVTQMEADCEQI